MRLPLLKVAGSAACAAVLTFSLATAVPADGVDAAANRAVAVVDHVADGDTIQVEIGARSEYVRLIGIDTPEVSGRSECGGPRASASMKRMVEPGDRVRLVPDRSQGNRDQYGRLLRYVQFEGRDLGRQQVVRGWASVYVFDRAFKRVESYRRSAKKAKKRNRGIWTECGG